MSVTLRVRRVSASSSLAAGTVTSVGVITAGSVEDLSTAGQDDCHAPRLEEILIHQSVNPLAELHKRNIRGSTSQQNEWRSFAGLVRSFHQGTLSMDQYRSRFPR